MVTTIEEELSYAQSYLSIMAMRKTLAYEITASKEIKKLPIIPLLLQPLIENAVEHGLEERESAHMIKIQVYQLDEYHIRFEVSDDGIGMDEMQIEKLLDYIRKKEHTGEGSVGLWNVNQRLCNRYSEKAQLQIERNRWGGITISFTLELERMKHAGIISGR